MKYKRLGESDYRNSVSGEFLSLWVFLDYLQSDSIMPEYGEITKIIISGYDTNLYIPEFSKEKTGMPTSLKELCSYSFECGMPLIEFYWKENA